jgi:hypothetical protein
LSARSFRRARERRLAAERKRAARRATLVAGAALTAVALAAPVAHATDFPVSNLTDAAAGSLRDAISQANTNPGPDTISFQPGLTGTITLTSGEIAISDELTINGPGASVLSVAGGGTSRIFNIAGTTATINGLTITDGAVNGNGAAITAPNSQSALTLVDSVVSGSTTTSGDGGGIYAAGHLTLTRTTVSGNTSSQNGGGIELHKYAHSTITDSTISGNTATSNGGGIETKGGGLTVTSSTVTGNSALDGGGIASSTKYGLTLSDSTISQNAAPGGGGGLLLSGAAVKYGPSVITRTTISGNTSATGAGALVVGINGGSPVTIDRSTISGNVADPVTGIGGGLAVGYIAGRLRTVDSTISGNTAPTGAGVSVGLPGAPVTGAMCGCFTGGSVAFDNSTIAGNAASAHGGGVYLAPYPTSGAPGAPVVATVAGLTSTIVADNVPDDLDRADTATSGGFNSAFSLIEAKGDAPLLTQAATLLGVDPQLGALANNGGPTRTELPAVTSPVIDQGKADTALTLDQIGAARTQDTYIANPPIGDGTDIGAVEVPASSVPVPPPPPPPNPAQPTDPGFAVTIGGTPLGGALTPLLAGNSSPVVCSVNVGLLSACVLEFRASADISAPAVGDLRGYSVTKGTVLGTGSVTAIPGGAAVALRAELTPPARSLLRRLPLGFDAAATAVGSTTGAPTVVGTIHVLHGNLLTLGLGTRSRTLSAAVNAQLDQLAKLIVSAKTVSCTAYTDPGRNDIGLTRAQAKAACARLAAGGVKATMSSNGYGHSGPIVRNISAKGRAVNRRLVIRYAL